MGGWPTINTSAACQHLPQSEAAPAGEVLWVKANGLRLKTTIYRSAKLSSHPVLIVVLHGDLLGVRAIPRQTYHYVFAHDATMKMDDLVVAALLRPGYRDDTGEQSQGERGLTTGDNYTPEVVDAVAQVIDQLKGKFHPARTVLAGHSGGDSDNRRFAGPVAFRGRCSVYGFLPVRAGGVAQAHAADAEQQSDLVPAGQKPFANRPCRQGSPFRSCAAAGGQRRSCGTGGNE